MMKTNTILQNLMKEVEINDYLELSRKSQVSELQFYRLENNLLDHIPLGVLKKIAQVFNISVTMLIEKLENIDDRDSGTKNEELTTSIINEYQRETISILESLLLQLPTFSYAVKNNPDLPAIRLLPLLEPLNKLLSSWEIDSIGKVGDIVTYNPQEHELMDYGDDDNPTQVEIRYVGYRQKDKLLYRAKVSPVTINNE